VNALNFLVKRRRVEYWLVLAAMTAYILVCALLLVKWVVPSLESQSDVKIGADSSTYLYMADSLREGRNDPLVLGALTSFPNTYWMPVLFALALNNNFLIALANVLIFLLAVHLYRQSSDINVGLFLFLLLLNPTTTVSLLTVNKEIVDLFVVALFCYFLSTGRKWVLWIALIISLVNRYEVFVVMLTFIFIRSRLNPLRQRRSLTLCILILSISIFLPLLAGGSLSYRFEEASGAGLVAFLDTLEIHYLFALAVIPKILQNMFGELLNVSGWGQYTATDIANSYILFFNNFASMVVVLVLLRKRLMKISSDWIYLAFTAAVFMAISLVNQPRYFYLCFVLFCFQAAHPAAVRYRRVRMIPTGEIVANT
jgi:hypothetical protein